MIDIHAHILPNLDDGSESLEESLEMAELAVESGVEIMAVTPHSNQMGRFENFQSVQLEQSFEQLREALKREKIQLQILEGMEIWASDDIAQKIKNKQLGGINGTAYYLVEFPFDADPWWIRECLEEIRENVTRLRNHPSIIVWNVIFACRIIRSLCMNGYRMVV